MLHGIQVVMNNGYGRRVACTTVLDIKQVSGIQLVALAPFHRIRYYIEKKDQTGQFRRVGHSNIRNRVHEELAACIMAEVTRLSKHKWG